jgi:FkbM family methyltransferase
VNNRSKIKYGCQFKVSRHNTTIEQVFDSYKFNDVREDDIVLDIGANVGGFSLFISKMVKKVYAVEPLVADTLRENISLNKIDNIIVLEKCLGKGKIEISWLEEKKEMTGISLSELIKLCGGEIDFLKCDCEGGEWSIKPEELEGIRRIEMEVHNLDGKYDVNNYLEILDDAGFKYTYKISTEMIVHATKRPKL